MGKGADSRAHGRFPQRRTSLAALNSLLGSTGSLPIVYQGKERATGKAWAIKEITKASLHADDLSSLEVCARCACRSPPACDKLMRPRLASHPAAAALQQEVHASLRIGSHPHIVFLKEFVENHSRSAARAATRAAGGGRRPPSARATVATPSASALTRAIPSKAGQPERLCHGFPNQRSAPAPRGECGAIRLGLAIRLLLLMPLPPAARPRCQPGTTW